MAADERLAIGAHYVNAREADIDLGSIVNRRLVRSWLHECRTTHKSCAREVAPTPPHRVVDKRRFMGSSSLRLLCIEEFHALYVTLRHCWAGKLENSLPKDKLQALQHSLHVISWSQLH